MTRILVVDDETQIRKALSVNLTARGYDVDLAATGEEALARAAAHHPDLVLLDIGLPGIDGVQVVEGLRGWTTVPIIMLSVRDSEADKVRALDAGADDYVTKPFSPQELLARVRAALRRTDSGTIMAGQIIRGDLTIDVDRRRVVRGDDEIRLTPKEFELMVFFAQHPDRVLTHKAILKAIWGPNAADQPEHLRVLVNALRRKIERDPTHPRYVVTEPWVGYRFATA
jgi:two-component system KDP operon response regulator KdpE